MPRRTHANSSQKRWSSTPERSGGSKRQRPPSRDVDAQALALREGGNSFSAIARRLELERAVDAHRSFVRALGAHGAAERLQLVQNEEARLDRLEQRIRDRDSADPAKIERRLLAVTKLREALRP